MIEKMVFNLYFLTILTSIMALRIATPIKNIIRNRAYISEKSGDPARINTMVRWNIGQRYTNTVSEKNRVTSVPITVRREDSFIS